MKICDLLKNIDIELICGDKTAELVTFERDSREVKDGDCYIAIVGDNFDGNNFILSAIENGAKSIICSRELNDVEMDAAILLRQFKKLLNIEEVCLIFQ